MPRRYVTLSQAHPTQVLSKEILVGVRLRGAGLGNVVTPCKAMMAAVLGLPSPDFTGPTRAMILVHRSPWLGELVVAVGRVSRWQEDHVIAIAKGHELQAPKLDHRGQRKWMFGVSHPEKWWENDVNTQCPYLARQLSASRPGRPLSR
jgi:hypothetical protein